MGDDPIRALVTELGITDMTPDEQELVIEGFGEVALKAATIAILERVPEEKRPEFVDLAENGDGERLDAFLSREVPDHAKITSEAIALEAKRFKASLTA